jgi:hypothetical protein
LRRVRATTGDMQKQYYYILRVMSVTLVIQHAIRKRNSHLWPDRLYYIVTHYLINCIIIIIIIISVVDLGQLLTRSLLTYPEVSSKVCHGSFCQLGNTVSTPWVIYYEEFYLNAGPEAKVSNPTTGLTLLWARNPFRGNFNH